MTDEEKKMLESENPDSPVPAHYSRATITQAMVGQKLDPALIAECYSLTPMMFTSLKKILRCGESVKDQKTDIYDTIGALQRELELIEFRSKSSG